jgi:hypothetical protein
MRHDDTASGAGEDDMLQVVRAVQIRFTCGRHVDGAASKSLRYAGMDLLIEVEFDCPGMVLSEFLRQDGRIGSLHILNESVFFPYLTHDLIAVVPEIGQGGMDGSHAQLREIPDNLVSALPRQTWT